jgi:hypothetical protein
MSKPTIEVDDLKVCWNRISYRAVLFMASQMVKELDLGKTVDITKYEIAYIGAKTLELVSTTRSERNLAREIAAIWAKPVAQPPLPSPISVSASSPRSRSPAMQGDYFCEETGKPVHLV